MPGGYWSGLVEGFQGRRESEFKQNYEREVQNRQMADRVFGHLLASRDPEIQQIALAGLMQPINKKKGFRGFLGEVDSTNPLIQQIVARSNEMVPDEDTGAAPAHPTIPEPPAGPPGSAAMSTNQTVTPGAAPINAPPAPLPGGGGMGPQDLNAIPAPPMGPDAGGGPAAMMPPPPPPEHPMHRRGTGVPTAEEIAGATTQAQLEGRIKATTAALLAQGASKADITRAIMGLVGAPQSAASFGAGPTYGVKLPDGKIVPASRDNRTGAFVIQGPNGQPVPMPEGSEIVKGPSGSTTKRNVERDPDSPTGFSAVYIDPGTGEELYRTPTEYNPAPAYAGTTVTPELGTNVPQRVPILRGGGTGPPLGDEPSQVQSQTQLDAEALLAAVDNEVRLATSSNLLKKSPTPQQQDQIVRRKAQAQGLPYQSYDDLMRAARSSTPITQRERTTGGTVAERVRARILQNRGGGEARPPVRPSLPPASPAPQAPARARGAGPVGQ